MSSKTMPEVKNKHIHYIFKTLYMKFYGFIQTEHLKSK